MNILILEDSGWIAYNMEELLTQKGHNMFNAGTIDEAQDFWKHEQIDCIISDLNMDPEGLSSTELEKTQNGLLTGWIWLNSRVFSSKPSMREKTVIYSAYANALKSIVVEELLSSIRIVAKSSVANSVRTVLEHVYEIAAKLPKEGE